MAVRTARGFFGGGAPTQPSGAGSTRESLSDAAPNLVQIAAVDQVPQGLAASSPCLGSTVVPFDVTAAGADTVLARVVLTRGLYLISWYVTCSDPAAAAIRRCDIDVDITSGGLLCRANGLIHYAGGPLVYQGEMYVWMHTAWQAGANPCARLRNVDVGVAANITIGHLAAVRLWTDLRDRTT